MYNGDIINNSSTVCHCLFRILFTAKTEFTYIQYGYGKLQTLRSNFNENLNISAFCVGRAWLATKFVYLLPFVHKSVN